MASQGNIKNIGENSQKDSFKILYNIIFRNNLHSNEEDSNGYEEPDGEGKPNDEEKQGDEEESNKEIPKETETSARNEDTAGDKKVEGDQSKKDNNKKNLPDTGANKGYWGAIGISLITIGTVSLVIFKKK